jgi:hypothetical protein
MAELKTTATKASVAAFINGIEDEERRKDCKAFARRRMPLHQAARRRRQADAAEVDRHVGQTAARNEKGGTLSPALMA